MTSLPASVPGKNHLQAAVAWYLALNDNEVTPDQHQAWQRWLDADPAHVNAWARIEKLQQQLRGVPGELALPVLSQMGVQRRQGLKLLLLLATGAATFAGYRSSPYSADFTTGTGQRRHVKLPDGSRLDLNTDTQVDIAYSAQQRLIVLRQGEIFVTTASEQAPARPLAVQTPHGRVLALGTRFDVRVLSGFSTVEVEQHAVEVSSRDAPRQVQRVEHGQALTFGAAHMGNLRLGSAGNSAWIQGVLVAIDWRLADFIGELSRYRAGYLGCAEQVADLRISGAFRLDDIDGVLANLQVSLPVKVRQLSRYWVRIEA